MEFHFHQQFRLRPKMKNTFRSASSIHHKNVSVLVLKCKVQDQDQVLVLVLNTRLGLGHSLVQCLEIKALVLVLVLKKSLDYIIAS